MQTYRRWAAIQDWTLLMALFVGLVVCLWSFSLRSGFANGAELAPAELSIVSAPDGTIKSAAKVIKTNLSEDPFVFTWSMPLNGVAYLPSRHVVELTCRSEGSASPLGWVSGGQAGGVMRKMGQGYAFDALAGQRFECRQASTGPAHISVVPMSANDAAEFELSHQKRVVAILAGFAILIAYSAISALINRDARHAWFALFLLGNMRLALMSIGADADMFFGTIANDMMPRVRMLTTAFGVGILLKTHAMLLGPKLEREPAWLRRWGTLSMQVAIGLLVASTFMPFKLFLPILWVISTNASAMLLARTVLLGRNGWPDALTSLGVLAPGLAGFVEVVAAATGAGGLLPFLNHESGALATSMMAALAFAIEMRERRDQAKRAEDALRLAFDSSPMGLFQALESGEVERANPAMADMIGESPAGGWSIKLHVDPLQWEDIVESAKIREGEPIERTIEAVSKDGARRYFDARVRATADGKIEGSLQDATEREAHKARLEFLAYHDPLTECLNLRGLERVLDVADHERSGGAMVAYFDLDRFKLINDVYGHETGDAVLIDVTERLQSALGQEAQLGRVGGDEFLAVFSGLTMDQAQRRCEIALLSIKEIPFTHRKQAFRLSASAGLVEAKAVGAETARALVGAADSACRMAKTEGGARLIAFGRDSMFYERRLESHNVAKVLDSEEGLSDLKLMAQPIVSLARPYDSLNFEVLLRMRMPGGKEIGAQALIETAEAHGKIARVDYWVLENTLDWIARNRARLDKTRFICVNLSGASLNDEAFLDKAFELMARRQSEAALLCLEITESVALRDLENMALFVERARSIGARVALDDFGAGYSSFGYLRELPADALKVDGSLARGALQSPPAQSILASLATLARALGMRSIGEWAEDEQVLSLLARCGFDYAQGYAVARPMPIDQILTRESCAEFAASPEIASMLRDFQRGVRAPGPTL